MPAPLVKKYAEEKGMSLADAEKKWNNAKEEANSASVKKNSINYWKYVTAVFKKMMGI